MKTIEAAGPDVDLDFFNDLRAVFEEHAEAAQRYSVDWLCHEKGELKIDFDKQHAVSHVEGNRIVTEFQDCSASTVAGSTRACCKWIYAGGRWWCVRQCEV